MKIKSTLPPGNFLVHIVVLLDVLTVVVVLGLLSSQAGFQYGYNVKIPSSRFLMNSLGKTHVLSVSAGDTPVYYLDKKRLDGGMSELQSALDDLATQDGVNDGERVTIMIVADGVVNHAQEQELIDIISSRGMYCAFAAEPRE